MHACNDSIIAYNSWGCGGAVSPPVGPGIALAGVQGAEPPEALGIIPSTRP